MNFLCDVRLVADDVNAARGALCPVGPATTPVISLATATAHLAIEHIFRLPLPTISVQIDVDVITLTGVASSAGDLLAVEVAVTYLADHQHIDNQLRCL